MDGPFQSRRVRRRPGINITPLIDVMFILIIFFTVSSTFRSHIGLDILLPRAVTGVEQEHALYEIVVDGSGAIFWEGRPVDTASLRAMLRELLAREPDATIILQGDEAAPFQAIITAMDAAREAGGVRLILPTRFGDTIEEE
ncbi:MAG TPA: biopolymer transporter ExbD [Candidatus Hydrogenedentes bacterium]|nr:biopolymer transporter ExbD [Candidatus Hydrogenedentota bacterium]